MVPPLPVAVQACPVATLNRPGFGGGKVPALRADR